MRLLVIDNYDSFTYNLSHYAEQFCDDVSVIRNDEIGIDQVAGYDKIILSPGPGLPEDAGIMMEAIKRYANTKSILGICLGMQGIVECYGGSLHNMEEVKHGLSRTCTHFGNDPIYEGVPERFEAGRYHSWAVSRNDIGSELVMTALDDEDIVMSVRHKEFDVSGVQFHPESIMTPHGLKMIENWLAT